ncbi:MAG: Nucleoside 2-deoxyribosyltransferase [Methanosaeta sp. PtaB.Bin039]|nr:MAG: Nucleoside 2-deoxyribosyltransferase [Methanosaeta sp. PtaB.Bin039]HOT06392.1 nucleoside 2-deoxyribosyltransferase [Methanotrichaceae archaeon]HQF16163.1 nucleoside 2-deoxyribosyltransferase [Methanotrichaceae archaeon]HQI90899.1 nucleoside 2-deoxyribosyltransferase [Methanotrichaceae archaeon]HQJ28321.1 nucleoside 2-deoxyribosyltransferase [Methanotrichaceae archaeon]
MDSQQIDRRSPGPRIYLAGPLFSKGEQDWCRQVRRSLEEGLGRTIFWPGDMPARSKEDIFQANCAALCSCDLLVAILDGAQVDDGTAWEVGFCRGLGVTVIGIRTDLRRAGETGTSLINAMVEQSCKSMVRSVEELVQAVRTELKEQGRD